MRLAEELQKKLEIPRIAAVSLVNRGYLDEKSALEYIRNDTVLIHDPFMLPDMEKACDTVIDSLDKNEKICVYGDYDVDGVTATALVYSYLKSKGADVMYYIPDRKTEGYGMNTVSVEKIASLGVQLIITVDNGITAVDEIAYARSMGIKVVITDHHSCHSVIPDANAAVNPKIPGCEYPYIELAGVGVAFKTVCALETVLCKREGKSVSDAIKELCYRYSDIVTIGTIADVMPLRDENRLFCSMGLQIMDKKPSVALDALMYMALLGDTVSASAEYYMNKPRETRKRKINSSYIGFVLAPRINAAGRVTHANDALRLLLAEDKRQAAEAAYALCSINNARKTMEGAIFSEAVECIEKLYTGEENIIVLDSDTWQHGVIGIVASRILEKYGLPVVMISFEDGKMTDEPSPMDVGKGSCRSVEGFDIHEALGYCSDLFVRYGGHELAAGLTIYRKDLDEFKARISKYAAERLNTDEPTVSVNIDCRADFSELTLECVNTLAAFEPFGTGNEQPYFCTENVLVKRVSALSGGKYVKVLFEKDGVQLSGISFSMSYDTLPVYVGEYADVAYALEVNEFRGVSSVQLTMEDVRLSSDYLAMIKEKSLILEKMIDGDDSLSLDGEICPERKDFVALYGYMRKASAEGMATFSLRRISSALKTEQGMNISVTATELMLNVFHELGLLRISRVTDDTYEVIIPPNAAKTDLSASKLLDRYRKACTHS